MSFKTGLLKAIDGLPITPRSISSELRGEYEFAPIQDVRFSFYYSSGQNNESSGITVIPEHVESMGNVHRYVDATRRVFELVEDK